MNLQLGHTNVIYFDAGGSLMSITYVCPHCKMTIGHIESRFVSEEKLGFHSLTLEERKDIITYNQKGDLVVRISCDYCQDAVSHNPELALIKNPLQ